jgi:hypothetical protein
MFLIRQVAGLLIPFYELYSFAGVNGGVIRNVFIDKAHCTDGNVVPDHQIISYDTAI